MDRTPLDQVVAETRPRLLSIAYRMVGSVADAEDIVGEAMVRFHAVSADDRDAIDSPAAYLTTVTTRLAIDHLRSAPVRRAAYVGPWLPEPITVDPAPDASEQAVLADSLSMAMLILMETLSPDERVVVVMHDVFAFSHAEIGEMLDRSEGAVRQLLRRARRRIQAGRPRVRVDPGRHEELVRQFVAACAGADIDAFVRLIADDAVLVADGGPVRRAARRPVLGAKRISRLLAYIAAHQGDHHYEVVELNGEPAVVEIQGTTVQGAILLEPTTEGGEVAFVRWVRNPDKLRALENALKGRSAR